MIQPRNIGRMGLVKKPNYSQEKYRRTRERCWVYRFSRKMGNRSHGYTQAVFKQDRCGVNGSPLRLGRTVGMIL